MATKRVDFVVSEKGTSKVAGGFNKVDSSMVSAAKSAAKYAAVYIGARGIISLTQNAITAFGIQEDAEKKLATALGRTSQALLQNASALQRRSNYGDEAIIGVQSSIAAFIKDEEQIKAATKATLDFAAAQGMDLKGAGDLVAKTLGSTTNALTRYGIEVTGAVGSSERLKSVTDGIARVWGGQAAAAAETMAGRMNQAKMAAGDLAETFGSALAPTVILVSNRMTDLIQGYQEFLNMTKGVNSSLDDELTSLDKINAKIKDLNTPESELNGLYRERIGILRALDNESRKLLRTDDDLQLIQIGGVELMKEQSDVINDLRTDYQKLGGTALDSGLKGLAMSQNLGEASRALANQYLIEGVFGAVKSALVSVPFPFNILAAGGASIAANALFNSIIPAATGADFNTSGPQLMLVGEAGREHVSVTPLEGPNINGPQGGSTFNFYGDIIGTDEYVENNLIPAINLATQQGRASIA